MANVITKLLLDNNDFNKKITSTKAEMKAFDSVGNTAMSMLKGFAGAAGIAMTASAAFSKMLENNAALGKRYAESVEVGKNITNQFFASIESGDFSGFINGLNQVINRAVAAADAILRLKSTMALNGAAEAGVEADIAKQREIIRRFGKNSKEAQQAAQKIKLDQNDLMRYKTQDANANKNAGLAKYNEYSGTAPRFNSVESFNAMFGSQEKLDKQKQIYDKERAFLKRHQNVATYTYQGTSFGGQYVKSYTYDAQAQALLKSNGYRTRKGYFSNIDSKRKNEIYDSLRDSENIRAGVYSMMAKNDRLMSGIEGSGIGGSTNKIKSHTEAIKQHKVEVEGYAKALKVYNYDSSHVGQSSEGYDKLISDLKNLNRYEKDTSKVKAHLEEIDNLTRKKEKLEIDTNEAKKSLQGLSENISLLQNKYDAAGSDSERVQIQKQITDEKKKQWQIEQSMIETANDTTASGIATELEHIEEGINDKLIGRSAYENLIITLQKQQIDAEYNEVQIKGSYLDKLQSEVDKYQSLLKLAKAKKEYDEVSLKLEEAQKNLNVGTEKKWNVGSANWYQSEISKRQDEQGMTADPRKYQQLDKEIKKLKKDEDNLGKSKMSKNFESLNQGIKYAKGLSSSFNTLFGNNKLTKNINKFINQFDALVEIIQSVTEIMQILGITTKATSTANIAAGQIETKAYIKNKGEEVAADLVAEKAAAALMAARATAAYAEIPVAGVALAGTQIAAMEALIKSASLLTFAQGGVVRGPFSSGDNTIIRANAGEMILNGSQQSHLFNMLNTNSSTNNNVNKGTVQFKIKGQELVGILRNYDKKISRIR